MCVGLRDTAGIQPTGCLRALRLSRSRGAAPARPRWLPSLQSEVSLRCEGRALLPGFWTKLLGIQKHLFLRAVQYRSFFWSLKPATDEQVCSKYSFGLIELFSKCESHRPPTNTLQVMFILSIQACSLQYETVSQQHSPQQSAHPLPTCQCTSGILWFFLLTFVSMLQNNMLIWLFKISAF